MTGRLAVRIGDVELANPIVCGAGEHLIEASGVHAAIAAGAGAVVVKSANESEAARRQLDHTDYALLGDGFGRLEWNGDAPIGASLLNRSGQRDILKEASCADARRAESLRGRLTAREHVGHDTLTRHALRVLHGGLGQGRVSS